jgi:hypothetical protein
LSIADYAQQVLDYLYDNGFEYADQDHRGPTFPGGILMDLGGGQKVAFLLPTHDLDAAVTNLRGHLETIYPQGSTLDPTGPVREQGIIRLHVRLNVAELSGAVA